MRKIHVTRQLFEASGRHGDLIEKTKNPFLDKIFVAKKRGTDRQTNRHTEPHIQVNLRISSTGCSPHVDFENSRLCQLWALRSLIGLAAI